MIEVRELVAAGEVDGTQNVAAGVLVIISAPTHTHTHHQQNTSALNVIRPNIKNKKRKKFKTKI